MHSFSQSVHTVLGTKQIQTKNQNEEDQIRFDGRNAKYFTNDRLYSDDNFTSSNIRWGLVGARVDPGNQRRNRKKLHAFLK